MKKLSYLLVAVLLSVAFISCKQTIVEEIVTGFEGTWKWGYVY